MKKMTRTIIAAVTILVFALTSSAAFAADGAGVKSGIKDAKASPVVAQEKAAPLADAAAPVQPTVGSTGYFDAKTLNYASSKPGSPKVIKTKDDGSYKWYSIGVHTSGKLYVDVGSASYNENSVSVVVSTTKSTSGSKGSTGYVSPGTDEYGIGGVDVKAGKVYYVGIQSYSYAVAAARAYVYSYKTRTLKAGKTMIAPGYKGYSYKDSAVKYKIKPKKTGYMLVDVEEYGTGYASAGYVQLLNKKKKAVSDKLWFYEGSNTSYVVFGVKKGTTYYLKATDFSGSYDNCYVYGIAHKIKKSPVRYNKTRRKALKLKRKGAYKKTTIPANNKSGNQWYKFRVTKKRTTKIKLDTTYIKSGTIKLTLYAGGKKIDSTTVSNGDVHTYTITHSTTWGKANRGTYYLKIHKSKKATGQYKIKYLK